LYCKLTLIFFCQLLKHIAYLRGAHIFQESRNHLKILGIAVQNSVAWTTCYIVFMHSWVKGLYKMTLSNYVLYVTWPITFLCWQVIFYISLFSSYMFMYAKQARK